MEEKPSCRGMMEKDMASETEHFSPYRADGKLASSCFYEERNWGEKQADKV